MVNYEFYTDTYGGSLIPPTLFLRCKKEADNYISKSKVAYTIYEYTEEEMCMAVCAVAESLFKNNQNIVREKSGLSEITYGAATYSYFDDTYLALTKFLRVYRGG